MAAARADRRAAAFWFLTALARGHLGEPAAPRYLYPGAVFLLLIAVEAAAGVRLSRGALAVAAVILAGALIGNVGAMREGAGYLRDQSAAVDGALAALPLVATRVGPDFQPDPASAPQIRADAYLDAVRASARRALAARAAGAVRARRGRTPTSRCAAR